MQAEISKLNTGSTGHIHIKSRGDLKLTKGRETVTLK